MDPCLCLGAGVGDIVFGSLCLEAYIWEPAFGSLCAAGCVRKGMGEQIENMATPKNNKLKLNLAFGFDHSS